MSGISTKAFFHPWPCFSAANCFCDPSLGKQLHNGPQGVFKKSGSSLISYLHLRMVLLRLARSPLPCLASSMSFHVPIYKSHLSPVLWAQLLLPPSLPPKGRMLWLT